MPRIAGVDIPKNKQIWVSLQYIYGIGPTLSQDILAQTGISAEVKADNLTEEEISRLREILTGSIRLRVSLEKRSTSISSALSKLAAIVVSGTAMACPRGVNRPRLMPGLNAVPARQSPAGVRDGA